MRKISSNDARRLKYHILMTFTATFIALFSFLSVTLSWFQSARRIDTNVSGIYVTNLYNATISLKHNDEPVTDGIIGFDEFYPGEVHQQYVEITITNNSQRTMETKWFFKAPTSLQEIPYVDTEGAYGTAGDYYYLASQIQLSEFSASIGEEVTDTAIGEDEFLLETSNVGVTKGQVNGVSEEISGYTQFLILDGYLIDPGLTAVISLTFTFVDNGTSQNVYQTAWPSVGVCQRHLGLYMSPVYE
jgi:hypothetical protein